MADVISVHIAAPIARSGGDDDNDRCLAATAAAVHGNINVNVNVEGAGLGARNNVSPSSGSNGSGNSTNNDDSNDTSKTTGTGYYVVEQPKDENLPNNIKDDPRGDDPTKRITKKASSRGAGRNTESFDPASTLVRPAMRVVVGNPSAPKFNKTLKHDDVVIVPELFGPEDNWDIYYKLVKEITELQESQVKNADFISWHEGAHLICKNPEKSQTFQDIISKLCDYFNIDSSSAGTRFNWYKDSSDWKPFHHDSAAFNPKRAKSQNITVGVSFGATRELAFIRASDSAVQQQHHLAQQDPVRLYFPQTNNGVFTFGRDVNILWKHGVNALKPEEQDGKGRISIILWGLARDVVEEEGSPPLLGSDGQGPHAPPSSTNHRHHRRGGGSGGGGGGGYGGERDGYGHGYRNNGGRHNNNSSKKRRFEHNATANSNGYYGVGSDRCKQGRPAYDYNNDSDRRHQHYDDYDRRRDHRERDYCDNIRHFDRHDHRHDRHYR